MEQFTTKEAVDLGNYLLSPDRRERFEKNPGFPNGELLEERLSMVHDADIENLKDIIVK